MQICTLLWAKDDSESPEPLLSTRSANTRLLAASAMQGATPLHAEHPTKAVSNSHDVSTAPKAHTFRFVDARPRRRSNLQAQLRKCWREMFFSSTLKEATSQGCGDALVMGAGSATEPQSRLRPSLRERVV